LARDNLITGFISDLTQGPHLYGIFDLGRIEQYFPVNNKISKPGKFYNDNQHFYSFKCSTVTQNELRLPKYSQILAREVARFHKLKIPIEKNPDIFYTNLQRKLEKIMGQTFENDNPEIQQNHREFIDFQINAELDQLLLFIRSMNSPVVFSHNDICFGNILKLGEDQLMLIDYEESNYNYRGFDIGCFFSSFMFNSSHTEFPYFTYDEAGFPSVDSQLEFVSAYVTESDGKCGLEEVLREGQAFALLFHLSSAIWAKGSVGTSGIKFGFKEWAIKRCEAYYLLKNKLFKDGFK